MESVLVKKAKRRQKKQFVEKLRRDKIKKSLEELVLLIPEARKQVKLGRRLRQTKILELVVDYVRSSQQEYKNFIGKTSPQTCCFCSSCEQRFQKYVHNTETCSPSDDPSVKLSREPMGSSVQKNSTSGCYRSCSTKFNTASDEFDERKLKERPKEETDEVTMEPMCKPPLQALKSFCTSILPNSLSNAVGHSIDVPSGGSQSSRKTRSSDSTLYQSTSHKLIPQTSPPTPGAQTLLASGNQRLWRPWIRELKTDE